LNLDIINANMVNGWIFYTVLNAYGHAKIGAPIPDSAGDMAEQSTTALAPKLARSAKSVSCR